MIESDSGGISVIIMLMTTEVDILLWNCIVTFLKPYGEMAQHFRYNLRYVLKDPRINFPINTAIRLYELPKIYFSFVKSWLVLFCWRDYFFQFIMVYNSQEKFFLYRVARGASSHTYIAQWHRGYSRNRIPLGHVMHTLNWVSLDTGHFF